MYEYCPEFFELIEFLSFQEAECIDGEQSSYRLFINDRDNEFEFELSCDYEGFCLVLGYHNNQYTRGIYVKDINAHLDTIIAFIEKFLQDFNSDFIVSSSLHDPNETKQLVQAAITTKDLSKNMVRVKSSNVWSYTINIRDSKDRTGNVLVTFKGKNGGPEDTYIYYDVPVTLWRKWVSAPSKGSFFWRHIRNAFRYSKLTGDKRGKLPNAVN